MSTIFFEPSVNRYSLVIDISSDEEDNRHSTLIKTVPVNMVGKLNISYSSLEACRTSDIDMNSTCESGCSPKKIEISPIKKKKAKVKFNLPPVDRSMNSEPDTNDYYEEPDFPRKQSLLRPSQAVNIPPK